MSQEEIMSAEVQGAYQQARAVKQAHAGALMDKANVVGVGVGLRQQGGVRTGEVALVVMVRQKVPREQLAAADVLPSEIEGVPVDVQQVGELGVQG
jgi:hypothetical protein